MRNQNSLILASRARFVEESVREVTDKVRPSPAARGTECTVMCVLSVINYNSMYSLYQRKGGYIRVT